MQHLHLIVLTICIAIIGCSPQQQISTTDKQLGVIDYRASGILAKSLPEITNALQQGEISSTALVELYFARIKAIDQQGPGLQSVLSINPDALAEAMKLDKLRANGTLKGPLHGIPILLKDNIESSDNMPTTAGALALKDNITGRDSPLVAGLRAQGAIILGKTNLSQWANFRSENSMSGWSALGGQVRNPHMLDRNPCGSSSGSGAATAASLAAATVGTETNGSVICPSNANGIVGFKPTVGIVPQEYIVPISVSQDTAGPMTKTVKGAAMMMNAMATTTPDIDYTAKLNNQALKGVRVGVLNFAKGSSAPITQLFTAALADLETAGAILVYIEDRPATPADYDKLAYDLLKFEFKDGLNIYLASTSPEQVKTRSLQELIAFNQQHKDIELTLFDQSIFVVSQAMGTLDSTEYKHARKVTQKTAREEGINKLLTENKVNVLVAPTGPVAPRVDPINGDIWPNSWPGYGSHAARAGYPHITVPMGGVHSLSVGLSLIGNKNTDVDVLAYAYAYEQQSMERLEPQYLSNAEELDEIGKAMKPYSK
ncbi:MAG: amidase [Paraglaciecola sp.]|jgi:amidase